MSCIKASVLLAIISMILFAIMLLAMFGVIGCTQKSSISCKISYTTKEDSTIHTSFGVCDTQDYKEMNPDIDFDSIWVEIIDK